MTDDGSATSTQNGRPDVESDASASPGAQGRPDGVTTGDHDKYPSMTAALGGVTAAVAVVLWVVRVLVSRRKPSTPQERLVEATSNLGSAAVGLGGRAARRTAAVAEPAARDAASFAAEEARKVAALAAEGAREVAEGAESVRKAWHTFVTRLIIVVFGGAGYVLGAAAGRERYDQIVAVAQRVTRTLEGGNR